MFLQPLGTNQNKDENLHDSIMCIEKDDILDLQDYSRVVSTCTHRNNNIL